MSLAKCSSFYPDRNVFMVAFPEPLSVNNTFLETGLALNHMDYQIIYK